MWGGRPGGGVLASHEAHAATARRRVEGAAQRLARRSALKAQAEAEYARAEAALAKVAAQALARSMIEGRGGAVPVAIGQLHGEGFFVDPAEAMVRADVLPDLYASLAAATSQRADAAALVDGLLTDAAAAARAKAEAEAAAAAKERAEMTKNCACGARRASLARLRRPDPASPRPRPRLPVSSDADFIKVYVRVPRRAEDVVANGTLPPGTRSVVDGRNDVEPVEVVDTSDGDGDFRTVVVGPVPVARVDLVSAIETRVHDWMLLHNNRHTRRVVLMAGGPTAPLTLWANNKRLPPGEPMVRTRSRARTRAHARERERALRARPLAHGYLSLPSDRRSLRARATRSRALAASSCGRAPSSGTRACPRSRRGNRPAGGCTPPLRSLPPRSTCALARAQVRARAHAFCRGSATLPAAASRRRRCGWPRRARRSRPSASRRPSSGRRGG
jgi:hypothetical protein